MARTASISLVVAMAENRVIGRDGDMPWHLPGDLQYFKRVTLGKPIIMGRKTYQSIGRPLPGRLNIVITRDPSYAPEGVMVVHSLDAALAAAQARAEQDGVDEIMIIGGGQIYADALCRAGRVYLTEVHTVVDGDTVFPDLAADEWLETSRDHHAAIKEGDPPYSFVILERIKEQTGG